MSMLSYAQNGEDVVLARAFPDASSGLYLDVGASDPTVDSVTKHFYDRGWRGINIEPALTALEKLRKARPHDVNLGLAVGEKEGVATFYELPQQMTGCSTFSADLAEQYRRDGWEPQEREVEIRTLAQVCEEHVGERDIDFIKIDVEGDELAVLAGADFERFRPRVLVIEATRPGTPFPAYEQWEQLVLSARYAFALFDGLNRFYVRQEDGPLAGVVGVPANYFDDYLPSRYATWKDEAVSATSRAQQADVREQETRSREQEAVSREQQANAREQLANAREQEALRSAAEQARRAQSIDLAVEQMRARLSASQAALRDARTELAAARKAFKSAPAKP